MEKFTASEVRSTIAANRDGVTDRKMEMLHAYADRLEADEKAEPVGWRYFDGGIGYQYFDGAPDAVGAGIELLYLHPAPADAERLAKALRTVVIRWFANSCEASAANTKEEIRAMGRVWHLCAEEVEELLSNHAAKSAQAQPQDIRCQRNSPAGCGCTTTCLALAQPAARTCSDERPCVNCFADQGGCLGPAPETVRQRKEQRAVEMAAAISTRHEFSRYESPLILGIVRATLAAQENPDD